MALSLEEVKFLQKQREKKSGMPALPTVPSVAAATNSSAAALTRTVSEKNEGEIEKDDLVLQDTFAQETAVMVEDPNMYVLLPSSYYVLANGLLFIIELELIFQWPCFHPSSMNLIIGRFHQK